MGQKYLIDSNVIIDYTANRLPEKASDFVEEIFDTDFIISVIVKIEVLGFDDISAKLKLLEEFIDTATVLSLDDSITHKTIALRRNKKLKLGDAIIAATSLENGLCLITRNVRDFKNIEGLEVINPFDISDS